MINADQAREIHLETNHFDNTVKTVLAYTETQIRDAAPYRSSTEFDLHITQEIAIEVARQLNLLGFTATLIKCEEVTPDTNEYATVISWSL